MTQPDSVVRLGKSTIQHGPANDRVYVMKLDSGDMPGIVDDIVDLGLDKGYSKLFARVSAKDAPHFKERGFVNEAHVPGMCCGDMAGYFMSRYLVGERAVPENPDRLADVLSTVRGKAQVATPPSPDTSGIVQLDRTDADALAALYGTVFESYPFNIDDPAYLQEAMASNVVFFGIRSGSKLVAASSAEIDAQWQCAEMTDFATLPECRGQGAASRLLAHMEMAVRPLGVRTAYTIARAESYGMNAVFAKNGYEFGGSLTNNTQIGGKLESMNVWHKPLASG